MMYSYGISDMITKHIMAALKKENIKHVFVVGDDMVDDEIQIVNHPLELHIQICDGEACVGVWETGLKDTMINYNLTDSVAKIVKQVKKHL